MNDRAVSLLENYDFTVLRTYKGRGAILCETDRGLKIMKEYKAPAAKLALMDALLGNVKEMALVDVDAPVADREGNFICRDRDGISYVVKDYFEGRECSPRDTEDLRKCFRAMALLHTGLFYPREKTPEGLVRFDPEGEFARQNALLRKIRKYLRERGNKTAFELALLGEYKRFEDLAEKTLTRLKQEDFTSFYEKVEREKSFIHGDCQYHNMLLEKDKMAVINFEKCRWDSPVGDLANFLRKVLEKCRWDPATGRILLDEYEAVNPLSDSGKRQLFYRLAYPEKFRKVANSYYNSNKAFQSQVYMEKLGQICLLEEDKEKFLRKIFHDMIE
ncbi:MAG: CotS family spore coat protein [Lachnospiraceae bacterium]|nr:CotS family spore coat protein [Lachnospiraceae bacterium]